jgi:hypothetical protein
MKEGMRREERNELKREIIWPEETARTDKAIRAQTRTGEDSTICQADQTGHLGDRQKEEEENEKKSTFESVG